MSGKVKVLFLDDEPHNLHAFKAAFRRDYDVLVATTTTEANELLEQNPDVSIVMSDQRMPGVSGVEYLEKVRMSFPAPVRMLISGYTDVESIIDGINRGNIFRYIRKPWEELDIRSAIEEGHRHYVASSQLQQRNEQLLKAYNQLDKFAHSVAHDLRSPIQSSLGAIELTRSIDDMDEIRSILDLVAKALEKLDDFIESTHDYYKIRHGGLHVVNINFAEFVQDLKVVYAVNGTTGDINFEVDVHQNEPFHSDKTAIKIILHNLLTNAFKYQRKDELAKHVLLKVDVADGRANIIVQDNGIGIPELYQQRVFELFYRATTLSEGSGFGLYNTKDALDKIQGTIDLKSVDGEGSTFTVSLPNLPLQAGG